MVSKSSKHWLVLIVCCGLAASSIGVSINSSGVFYTPVSTSLGIMRGTFSIKGYLLYFFLPKTYTFINNSNWGFIHT